MSNKRSSGGRARRRSMMVRSNSSPITNFSLSSHNNNNNTTQLPTDQRSESSSKSSSSDRKSNGAASSTNILVAVRVRPGLPSEEKEIHEHLYDIQQEGPLDPDMTKLAYDTVNSSVAGRKEYDVVPKTYTFDSLFGPNVNNPKVYQSAVRPIVGSVLEGYHATVFAYGMTGSGKTHTMVGNEKDPGIIPLSFEQIFKEVADNADHTDYSISISYLEIYCEIVRDIIEPSRTNLNIREDLELGVHIQGVSTHAVGSWEETKELLDKGAENRAVTATEMNAESSRSHAVLVARIIREKKATKERSTAKLFLVDLAGSERIGKSGVTGVALEEAKAINLSLSTLGLCIKALVDQKKPHVPFRSSKLTRLLKESLGGKARTVLIVAVRPGQPHIEETMSALQFGNRARKIKVHASKNVHKNWKLECVKLQAQLDDATFRNEKMTKKMIRLKRLMREGGLDDEDLSAEDDDDDDEEEAERLGAEADGTVGTGRKSKKKNTENRRRQSLHAAKSHKQALALQMKAMKQSLEAKLAEATSTNQSKDDELEMYKLQCSELKKNSSLLSNLVEKLQHNNYTLELDTTELNAKKEHLEDKVESLEYLIEETNKKQLIKYIELDTLYKTSTNQLTRANVDLRELELELRKSGSDNDELRNDMHGITKKHDTEIGKLSMEVTNMKKVLHDKQIKFKSQLRAGDYRHREIVRAMHTKERMIDALNLNLIELKANIQNNVDAMNRATETITIEQHYSNHLMSMLKGLRSEILRLHVHLGEGVDKQLQRSAFMPAKEYKQLATKNLRQVLQEKRTTESEQPADMGGGDEHRGGPVDVSRGQTALLDSMNRLINNLQTNTKNHLNLLWDKERTHFANMIHQAGVDKKKLRAQLKVEKERADYALSLVKAIKPLIKSL